MHIATRALIMAGLLFAACELPDGESGPRTQTDFTLILKVALDQGTPAGLPIQCEAARVRGGSPEANTLDCSGFGSTDGEGSITMRFGFRLADDDSAQARVTVSVPAIGDQAAFTDTRVFTMPEFACDKGEDQFTGEKYARCVLSTTWAVW
jgi:hypothetical protein